jgi:hypothetical protein
MIKSIGDNYRIYGLITVKTTKKLLMLDYGFLNTTLSHITMLSPSCQSRQVDLDLSCMTGGVFLIGRLLDYLVSHFDYWIMDHLIDQICTPLFLELLPNFFL